MYRQRCCPAGRKVKDGIEKVIPDNIINIRIQNEGYQLRLQEFGLAC